MITLENTCYYVEYGKIKTGKLSEFTHLIKLSQYSTHPKGYRFHVVEKDGFWVIVDSTKSGDLVIHQFETKFDADNALEKIYIGDILNTPGLELFLFMEDAESFLNNEYKNFPDN